MAKKLQFYRGPKNSIPALSVGEPGWVTDEERLYIGGSDGNVGVPNMADLEQVGSFYVSISGSEGSYTSDFGAQEIYAAYQTDKAVFAKIGENIIPLTHVSLSGSTYSAQFNVISGIEGYQNILITQSGETKHVYVTANRLSGEEVTYNNGTSGLTATDVQGAVDEVAGKFSGFIPSSEKGQNNGVATLDGNGKLAEAQKPTYTASEVGARPNNWTPSAQDIGAIPATDKGANNGVAELDGNGKVPSSQLPGYVDDVVDSYVVGSTPYTQDWLSAESGGTALTPESGKIYLVVSEGEYQNREYRWSGTQYAQISEGLALGETQDTAYRGDHGKAAYDHSQMTSGNPHHVTAVDVGAMTQMQGDSRYIQVSSGGTFAMDEAFGAGPYTFELDEEEDSSPDDSILTFGAQTVATTAWASDTTYSEQGYGFRASVSLPGVTTSHIPDVTFAMADAVSGNLAPLADTYDGGLYIYAKEQPTATVNIASVVCTKGA